MFNKSKFIFPKRFLTATYKMLTEDLFVFT